MHALASQRLPWFWLPGRVTSLQRMLVPALFAKPEMEPVSNYVPETPLSSLRGRHENPKLCR